MTLEEIVEAVLDASRQALVAIDAMATMFRQAGEALAQMLQAAADAHLAAAPLGIRIRARWIMHGEQVGVYRAVELARAGE